jgi:ferritin-like metal-binding protein YciE
MEKVFQKIQKRPRGRKCVGMQGLLQEGELVMTEEMDPIVRDSALIGAAQKVEHYEVSAYGTAIAYARLLGDERFWGLFQAISPREITPYFPTIFLARRYTPSL